MTKTIADRLYDIGREFKETYSKITNHGPLAVYRSELLEQANELQRLVTESTNPHATSAALLKLGMILETIEVNFGESLGLPDSSLS